MEQNLPSTSRATTDLLKSMSRYWWAFLLRGIAAIIFGILAFVWPGLTIIVLTMFWGAYALFDGAMALWSGISGGIESRAQRWWLAILGVLGILAGLIALFSPVSTSLILMMIIGAWAVAIGILQIVGAIRLRKEIEGEWLLAASGVVSIIFGLIFLLQPVAGAISLAWMIGLSSLVFGVLLIALSLKLKKAKA